MDEQRVEEIRNSTNLFKYSYDELRECDLWIKIYALDKLLEKLDQTNPTICHFVYLMAKATYGSVETDKFLTDMKCYPEWL